MFHSSTDAPFVRLLPELAIADVGEDFTFMCDVVGGQSSTFQWEKESEILVNETQSTLNLTSVAVSDAGLYQCTATTAAGSVSNSTQLYVAPNIITGPDNNTRGNAGDSITFRCVAEGFPVPDITWEYHGSSTSSSGHVCSSSGGEVINNGVDTTVNGTIVTSTLSLIVSYSSFGVYCCVANSSSLMRSESAETTLHGRKHHHVHTLCTITLISFALFSLSFG